MKRITLLLTLLFSPLVAFGGTEEQAFADNIIQLVNEAEAVHDMKSADALAERIRESEPLIMGSLMLNQKEIERIMTEAGYTEERIRRCAYKLVEKNCYGSGVKELALEKFESTPERREELFGIWETLQKKLPEQLIPSAEAISMLANAASPALYHEIGLDKEQYIHGIRTAQLIRKRYTVLDYLYTLGLLDAAIQTLV